MSFITAEQVKLFNDQAKTLNVLPIKVPPPYQQLVREEYEALGRPGGPLYRVVYPAGDRLGLRTAHEVPDFVEDQTNMPEGLANVLIHKYANRALFLVTDKCVGHCMYCFRQDVISDMQGNPLPPLEERIDRVLAYLGSRPEITELILSGGDPLTIPFRKLTSLFERLGRETQVTDIRIHSRNLVFAPGVVSEELAGLLGLHQVRVYLHVVHPYEIDGPVEAAIQRLQAAGVRTYSQFPILRGINDHVAVLTELLRKLDALRSNPINLFIPDPISYSASFRVPLKRLFQLVDELYWTTGSWTNGVRLVLDSPVGKVRREDIVSWDEGTGRVVFQRQGKDVVYHDFPAEMDTPGELATLLWRG